MISFLYKKFRFSKYSVETLGQSAKRQMLCWLPLYLLVVFLLAALIVIGKGVNQKSFEIVSNHWFVQLFILFFSFFATISQTWIILEVIKYRVFWQPYNARLSNSKSTGLISVFLSFISLLTRKKISDWMIVEKPISLLALLAVLMWIPICVGLLFYSTLLNFI